MSAGKRYVLDANVFIDAHQNYYAFDICPGFWNALIQQHNTSRPYSCIRNEVARGLFAETFEDQRVFCFGASWFYRARSVAVRNRQE